MGHHLLAVPGVTGQVPPCLNFSKLRFGALCNGENHSTIFRRKLHKGHDFFFVQRCLEQRPHLVSTGCRLLNE